MTWSGKDLEPQATRSHDSDEQNEVRALRAAVDANLGTNPPQARRNTVGAADYFFLSRTMPRTSQPLSASMRFVIRSAFPVTSNFSVSTRPNFFCSSR